MAQSKKRDKAMRFAYTSALIKTASNSRNLIWPFEDCNGAGENLLVSTA